MYQITKGKKLNICICTYIKTRQVRVCLVYRGFRTNFRIEGQQELLLINSNFRAYALILYIINY